MYFKHIIVNENLSASSFLVYIILSEYASLKETTVIAFIFILSDFYIKAPSIIAEKSAILQQFDVIAFNKIMFMVHSV